MAMKKSILASAIFLLVLAPATVGIPTLAAEGLPELGDTSQSDLSPQMEKRIGEEAMNDIRLHEPSYLDDAEIAGYLNRLVARLAANLDGPSQYFEVFPLKDATLNAFAMPGGYIGVHSGLILAAQSESELAGVLSHEISHVTQHHLARSIAPQKQGQMASLLAFAVGLLAARSRPDLAQGAIVGAQAAYVQSQLSYSRDFEREADRIGIQLLEKSGFDISGMASFFERLEQGSRIHESNAPGYLRTHPLTTERIADMSNRIQGRPYRQVRDSLDFQLVKAKLRAEEGAPQDAVTAFSTMLSEKKYIQEAVVHYGLARAYLRAGKLREAQEAVQTSKRLKLVSPMVESLQADIQEKQGRLDLAAQTLQAARKTYPSDRALTYQSCEVNLKMGLPGETIRLASEELQNYTTDDRLYLFLARAYAASGQQFRQHRAQAEAYVRQGRLSEAIEQLGFAQKAPDGDFYEHSQVDARVRDLKAQFESRKKEMRQ